MTHTPLRRLACALALALGLAPAAMAGPAVVVELYTSQGCSACPPADEVLGRLAKRDGIVPLSLHVHYWDYLGWRDTFADEAHAARQYLYRDAIGARVVYTPQMVVQGFRDVSGNQPVAVEAAIDAARAGGPGPEIRLEAKSGSLSAHLTPGPRAAKGKIWVAKYRKRVSVEIERGENRGRALTYFNVVHDLSDMGSWSGDAPVTLPLPAPAAGHGIALWVQEGHVGRIHAAAKFEN